MTLVYVFGSGECEQLGLGDDAPSEIKKPRRLQIFELGCNDFAAKSIIKVSCGGMHTVALASNGTLYSWGNNDDGALGRFGQENVPMRVDGALDEPMTDISTGDCHSIAYNVNENTVFYWGCYKDVVTGQSTGKVQVPTRIAQELFCDKTRCRIKKIVSGAQHTVALTDCKKVYAWGDAESGKIGRELKTRYKNKQSLKIEKTNAKNAKDVFCGRFHSFYVNDANQVFAWGMNNHGQLGLGHKNSIANAQRIRYLDPHEGDHVIQMAGGEHHSIALLKSGCVYCFGRNDEGQIGVGDLFGEYKRQKAIEDKEKLLKEEEEKAAEEKRKQEEDEKKRIEAENAPVVPEVAENQEGEATEAKAENGDAQINTEQNQAGEQADQNEKPANQQKGKKKIKRMGTQAEEKECKEEEDLRNIGYFPRPRGNEYLWKFDLAEDTVDTDLQKKLSYVEAAGNFCYAIYGDKNQLYSWGFGENYVLGNRDDLNEHKPHLVDERMFEGKKVVQVSCGTQHVVAVAQDTLEEGLHPVDFSSFVKVASELPPKKPQENDEEVEEESPELPEFNNNKSYSAKAGPAKSKIQANGVGEKAEETKASEATTALVEQQVAPSQKPQSVSGGKTVAVNAIQNDNINQDMQSAEQGDQNEQQMEDAVEEAQEGIKNIMSQGTGTKRTFDEHQDGLQQDNLLSPNVVGYNDVGSQEENGNVDEQQDNVEQDVVGYQAQELDNNDLQE